MKVRYYYKTIKPSVSVPYDQGRSHIKRVAYVGPFDTAEEAMLDMESAVAANYGNTSGFEFIEEVTP